VQDRPDARELLEAVRAFLEEEVVPALDGTRQFHARVAANVLAIVGRELAHGDGALRAERRRLMILLAVPPTAEPETSAGLALSVRELNATLADRIRAGDADREPWRAEVLAHLKATAAERLAIANPRYAGPRGRS
jgi:hypothetical protein